MPTRQQWMYSLGFLCAISLVTVGFPVTESSTDTPEIEVSITVEENYVHFYPVEFEDHSSDYQVSIATDGTWKPRHGLSGVDCDECYVYTYDSESKSGNSSHTAVRINDSEKQVVSVILEYKGDIYVVETVTLNED